MGCNHDQKEYQKVASFEQQAEENGMPACTCVNCVNLLVMDDGVCLL